MGEKVVGLPLPMVLTLGGGLPFVPRPRAWAALEDAWAGAVAGARRVVAVSGAAGVGKTRLVAEFARQVHSRGGAVLCATMRAGHAHPYVIFHDALQPLTTGHREVPSRGDRPGRTGSEPYRVAEAIGRHLATRTAHRPVLLVLDDLHHADAATAEVLVHLTTGPTPEHLLVLASFRTEPASVTRAARLLLGELPRRPGGGRLRLGGLDRAGVVAFVEAVTGRPLDGDLAAVVTHLREQTDGNLFLISELWHHLVETGLVVPAGRRWEITGALEDLSPPPSVVDAVAARFDLLPDATRDALLGAAVLGASFDVETLAGVLGTDVTAALAALEAAVEAAIVEETRPDGFRFVHPLVQRCAYGTQTGSARRRRHLAAARSLDDRQGQPGGAAVRHLLAAVPLIERSAVAAAARQAAQRAAAAGSWAEAATCLQTALDATDDGALTPVVRAELARAHHRLGHGPPAEGRAGERSPRRAATGEQPPLDGVHDGLLTERETTVVRLLVEGRSNRQIGDCLHISQHTAAHHVHAILVKTGCANRTVVASWAVRHGIVER